MNPQKVFPKHTEGPFAGLIPDDMVLVFLPDGDNKLMRVDKVNNHSIEGRLGGVHLNVQAKVTIVSPTELRFYMEVRPMVRKCFKGVRVQRWEGGPV